MSATSLLFVTSENHSQADEALRRAHEADKRRAEVNR